MKDIEKAFKLQHFGDKFVLKNIMCLLIKI